ncbi:nitric oxide-associated protein 1-like isoform X1 [Haliotis rufescens]|uniref:nitric oxide-associated protein 1-like isoform X1 n=1 Tax=Haliotis rufescens TaxID=6454 RepID=UPI00201EDF27|nr:nitric oxide-associated protein 1-like isoform X1 [Haliotis rufescens]
MSLTNHSRSSQRTSFLSSKKVTLNTCRNMEYVMLCQKLNQSVMFSLIRKSRQIHSVNRRMFSYSRLLCQRKEKRNMKAQKLSEKRQYNDHSDSVSVAIQMMSNKLRMHSKHGSFEKKIISGNELKSALEEISLDTEASLNKTRYEMSSNDMIDEDKLDDEMDDDGYYVETITLEDDYTESTSRKSTKRQVRISGHPDPSVPKSNIPCCGCGAELHCQDTIIPGYMPSEKFKTLTRNELKQSVCQRCHLMTHHELCLNVKVDANEYPQIISKIKQERGLVVVIVDLMDITNSIFPDLLKYIGRSRPLFIVGNKVDLVPKDQAGYLRSVRQTLFEECEKAGLNYKGSNIKHVCLISAKTGYGIEELVTKLMQDWQRQGHVFLVGCTNVGKSSVFNALLQTDYCKAKVRDVIQRATISVWPGTTLNLLKFPIIQPEGWRIHKRLQKLQQTRSEHEEEVKLQRTKLKEKGMPKYAPLQDSRLEQEVKKKEKDLDYEGQELVSFSMSRSGNLQELSGRQNNRACQPHDMSVLGKLSQSRWTYDTPGVVNPQQILTLLTPEELKVILHKVVSAPRVFVLNQSQTLFVSGLSRIDYCQGERSIFLTVHCSPDLPVHVKDTVDADSFYEEKIGTKAFAVPVPESDWMERLPALIGQEFRMTGIGWDTAVGDLQLSSLGWVSVMAHRDMEVRLRGYTPGGRGCHMRVPALLPNVLAFRGKRAKKSSPAYSTRKLISPR